MFEFPLWTFYIWKKNPYISLKMQTIRRHSIYYRNRWRRGFPVIMYASVVFPSSKNTQNLHTAGSLGRKITSNQSKPKQVQRNDLVQGSSASVRDKITKLSLNQLCSNSSSAQRASDVNKESTCSRETQQTDGRRRRYMGQDFEILIVVCERVVTICDKVTTTTTASK